MESARLLLPPDVAHPHLVLVAARSEIDLTRTAARLDGLGIQYRPFYEPDYGNQLTALATEPLCESRKALMRRYQCWNYSLTDVETPRLEKAKCQTRNESAIEAI